MTHMQALSLLAAAAWDLRASTEAQLRTLTSMQRCIEEFRDSPQSSTLNEIEKHVASIEQLLAATIDTLPGIRDAARALRERAE